ncbi:hypothetical protein IFR23_09315 [Sphingomonas sp. CFBP 13603]|uniref:hypothetical protein n=1 Tax=Sphingomonas sp. CFBP 13603 TaxID=2774040 RepID=UPI00186740EF|nr:hypothetical protein [Sphingomonas sp. CFBP 13603]MBE2992218.1 hypothetical protein [Sphingomonas sp. CFBP 13603]
MKDPVDACLASMAATPIPARLSSIETDVFAAIDNAARDDAGRRSIGRLSIGAALALGLVGGGVVGGTVQPAIAGPMSTDSLAPSTLLLGR